MENATNPAQVRTTDMKLEVIVIPVSDVNRAKQLYGSLGWSSTQTLPRVRIGARSSSRLPAPSARFTSART